MSAAYACLAELERVLDPLEPGRNGSGARVIGYGEVSAVLGLGTLPGRVLKRMSGFPTRARTLAYVGVVERYLASLRELGVPLVETELVPISTGPDRHVVYVVQPQLDAARFGNALLRAAPVQEIFPLLERVLEHVLRVLEANALRKDGLEIAIDAQLSNWHWPEAASAPRPLLIDVGTPFTRRHGEIEVGADLFLAAYPAPVRWWMRRTRAVEGYLGAFFDPRRTAIDLLGNFNKEGAPDKIPAALAFVNDWMSRQPQAGRLAPIELEDVRRYYANDAATLALSLRLRRLRRFLDTKLLRRRYDFILPGPIRR